MPEQQGAAGSYPAAASAPDRGIAAGYDRYTDPAGGAAALRENGMGGRHTAPNPGSDVFMALVILALLAILAAVIIPAALGS
jgi:hypothetical protein